jgi:excisionase family DNA binding protein
MTTTTNTWLGVLEIAQMLGISRSKVQALAKAGTIRCYRIGKSYRFIAAEVLRWVEAQRIQPEVQTSVTE